MSRLYFRKELVHEGQRNTVVFAAIHSVDLRASNHQALREQKWNLAAPDRHIISST